MSTQWHLPKLHVMLSDGTEHVLRAANPDLVRWDRTRATRKWPKHDEAPFLWLTFVAWAAMRREHLIADTITFELFSDEYCRAVTSEDDTVDPTQKAPEAG